MIRALTIPLLLACSAVAHAAQAPVDLGRLADALAQKETGVKWDGRPGRFGELSRYQITPAVWAQHSREPFETAARDEAKARAVALKHLAWLRARLLAAEITVTPERLATVWHFGPSHKSRASQWGHEVANLYEDKP